MNLSPLLILLAMQQPPPPTGLIGLPDEGVLLSGSPAAPILVNNTNRRIIGYTIRYINTSGPSINDTQLALLRIHHYTGESPLVIQPQTERSVPSSGRTIVAGVKDPSVPIQAILDAVIFDDGEVVGPDITHTLERVQVHIQAEHDIHQKARAAHGLTGNAKQAAWDEIYRLSIQDPSGEGNSLNVQYMQRTAANELLEVRERLGDDSAFELAKGSLKYPTLWRKQQ